MPWVEQEVDSTTWVESTHVSFQAFQLDAFNPLAFQQGQDLDWTAQVEVVTVYDAG